MESRTHLPLTQEALINFFAILITAYGDGNREGFPTKWYGDAALAAYNNFTIGDAEVDDFFAVEAALAPISEEKFMAYFKDKDSSIQYDSYLVFISTLRRLVRNTVMNKAPMEDFRFNHPVSPPLDAYKYRGADKVTDIRISVESLDFLTR